MANANRPMGLSPISYLNGAPWSGQCRTYSIAAAYNTALAIGDPVISSGTADVNGVPGIVIAPGGAGVSSGGLRGVIVGLGTTEGSTFNPLNLNQIIRPANDPAVWYAKVVDDPNVIFEVQEHTGAVQLAATEIGLNTVLFAGANNGYLSGWQLASTTDSAAAAAATGQVKLLGLTRKINNTFGAFAKWLIQINVHELGHGTGALGV